MERTLLMNLTITLVVPCIVLARKLFLYYVPGRTWLFLWKILIFQLLCPFTLKIQFTDVNITKNAVEFLQLQNQIRQSCTNIFFSPVEEILKIIWLLCGLIIAGFFIGSHRFNTKTYRMALPVQGEYFQQWKQTHCLKRKMEIRKSDRIMIPLTYGIVKPVIILPAYKNITEENLEAVLDHEFMHIKHFDVLLKWILVLLCSFYWYNPLIWVMYIFANRDIELSCDEALLKQHSPEYKKRYLLALIDLEEKISKPGVFCSSFCKHPTEERIKVMLKRDKTTLRTRILAFFITSMLLLLSTGMTASAASLNRMPLFTHSKPAKEIPDVIGQNEVQALKILQNHGFSFILIENTINNQIIQL